LSGIFAAVGFGPFHRMSERGVPPSNPAARANLSLFVPVYGWSKVPSGARMAAAEDPRKLRRQAADYRRIAVTTSDERAYKALHELATEFEALAAKMEASELPH
jgi:hypothetical protein